jgi:hypothetical protein
MWNFYGWKETRSEILFVFKINEFFVSKRAVCVHERRNESFTLCKTFDFFGIKKKLIIFAPRKTEIR